MTSSIRLLLLALVRLLVGAYAHWDGCAPSPRSRIYFANHASHLDTLVILAAMPAEIRSRVHPVAALDYWGRSRVTRFIAESCLRAVLLERTPRGRRDPLEPLAKLLEVGHSLAFFPEGTRSDGHIDEFRAGLFHLARRFPDVELVPIHLDNLHRILPKGTALLVPLICTVRVGAPIVKDEGEAKADFLERARSRLIELANQRASSGHDSAA